jgi:putative phosphoesterase
MVVLLAALAMREQGSEDSAMLIGVVSDTHGSVPSTQAAVRLLESLQVEAVLHCGDIGTASIPPLFQKWPTHFVFGNCDYDRTEVARVITTHGLHCHERFGEIELGQRRIALLHSDDATKFRQTIASGDYDLVCYGHTHQAEQHREGKTLVLNPGALYRANPLSIATVDLESMEVLFFSV